MWSAFSAQFLASHIYCRLSDCCCSQWWPESSCPQSASRGSMAVTVTTLKTLWTFHCVDLFPDPDPEFLCFIPLYFKNICLSLSWIPNPDLCILRLCAPLLPLGHWSLTSDSTCAGPPTNLDFSEYYSQPMYYNLELAYALSVSSDLLDTISSFILMTYFNVWTRSPKGPS